MIGNNWPRRHVMRKTPVKLMELIQRLNRALDEHMKNPSPRSSEAAG